MVHHNTVSLDKLVEMAWLEILTKYAVDEECDFLVSYLSLHLKLLKYEHVEMNVLHQLRGRPHSWGSRRTSSWRILRFSQDRSPSGGEGEEPAGEGGEDPSPRQPGGRVGGEEAGRRL